MSFSAALASDACAFFSAVRSDERWARLRAIAARDLRIFFFADAIFGTRNLQKFLVLVATYKAIAVRPDFKDNCNPGTGTV